MKIINREVLLLQELTYKDTNLVGRRVPGSPGVVLFGKKTGAKLKKVVIQGQPREFQQWVEEMEYFSSSNPITAVKAGLISDWDPQEEYIFVQEQEIAPLGLYMKGWYSKSELRARLANL